MRTKFARTNSKEIIGIFESMKQISVSPLASAIPFLPSIVGVRGKPLNNGSLWLSRGVDCQEVTKISMLVQVLELFTIRA